jgi:hypothetical protein
LKRKETSRRKKEEKLRRDEKRVENSRHGYNAKWLVSKGQNGQKPVWV